MAGSYNHIITDHGNLVSNERFVNMIGNLGDAYEMTEEMYGMVWWLAYKLSMVLAVPSPAFVKDAQEHYEEGLKRAKEANREIPWK